MVQKLFNEFLWSLLLYVCLTLLLGQFSDTLCSNLQIKHSNPQNIIKAQDIHNPSLSKVEEQVCSSILLETRKTKSKSCSKLGKIENRWLNQMNKVIHKMERAISCGTLYIFVWFYLHEIIFLTVKWLNNSARQPFC